MKIKDIEEGFVNLSPAHMPSPPKIKKVKREGKI